MSDDQNGDEARNARRLSRVATALLFVFVVTAWGLNWPVTKILVGHAPPIWTAAIRTIIATGTLLLLQMLTRQFEIPKRGDVPVVLAISIFHMFAFAVFMNFGLKYVPAGRSIVLGYTTALWVAPAAWLFLNENLPRQRLLGIFIGLAGLFLMFSPTSFDWTNSEIVFGNACLLLAAASWSVSILYTRAHRWIATPFQLAVWEAALASILLTILAFCVEGRPHVEWSVSLVFGFAYSGVIGTALAFWAMAVIASSLPAALTSLGILATPAIGIVISAFLLGERPSATLLLAVVLIFSGIAIGTIGSGDPARSTSKSTKR